MAVILPNNGRPRSVMNITSDSANITTSIVVVEDDAMSLTLYIDDIQTGTRLDIIVEEIGDSPDNVITVYSFPQITKPKETPICVILPVGGNIRITATYTGSIEFELNAKAVSAAAVVDFNIQTVSLELTPEDISYRNNHLEELGRISKLLYVILNHQRVITGIESDNEGDF